MPKPLNIGGIIIKPLPVRGIKNSIKKNDSDIIGCAVHIELHADRNCKFSKFFVHAELFRAKRERRRQTSIGTAQRKRQNTEFGSFFYERCRQNFTDKRDKGGRNQKTNRKTERRG